MINPTYWICFCDLFFLLSYNLLSLCVCVLFFSLRRPSLIKVRLPQGLGNSNANAKSGREGGSKANNVSL